MALGLGLLTDRWGLKLVPVVLVLLLAVGAGVAFFLPHDDPAPARAPPKGEPLFARASVRWFYATALLMQCSHGAYYGFMSIHLENNGYSRTAIGALWALGVVAEVLLMRHSGPLLDRFGVARILAFSLLAALIRWGGYAVSVGWPVLLFGQGLHAFTFGSFHVASVNRAFAMSPQHSRSTAQAWYAAFSFGLGGGLGLVVSGFVFARLGSGPLFLLMAAIAALGLVATRRSARLFELEKLL